MNSYHINKNNNTKWMTILLQVVIISSIFNSHVIIVSSVESANFEIADSRFIAPQQISGPVIGNPMVTPSNPAPSDTPTIDAIISDPVGINESRLFWEYNSNSTIFNSTMTPSTLPIIKNDADFITEGFVDSSGSIVPGQTEWGYSFYNYEVQEIESLDIQVKKGGGGSDVTYTRIEILNKTTNIWEEVFLNQGVDFSDVIGNQNFQLNQLVLGVKIFAVTFRNGQNANPPQLIVDLFEVSYSANILNNNVPAFVNYYIVANNSNGLVTTSPTYALLLDNPPTVTIDNLPQSTTKDLLVNVSVFDFDGESTINHSTVIAYYKPVNDVVWQSENLNFQLNFGGFALFTVNINLTGSGVAETDFEIMVNATDIVNGKAGYTGSSGIQTITLDNLGPRITNLAFIPGTFIQNATALDTEVKMAVTLFDNSGIKNATLYYSNISSANFNSIIMENITQTGINTQSSIFEATLPANNVSGFVDYYFELIDFLGNSRETSMNRYFPDGVGPQLLEELLIFDPTFISNTTAVNLLFNATDIAGVKDVTVWYTYNGSVWESVTASQIDYNNIELPRQKFDVSNDLDLPLLFKNADITKINLNVKRLLDPQDVILKVDITHERPSDIRLWLSIEGGKRVLFYDRVVNGNLNNIRLSLFDLGFTSADFDNNNITLEIEDINSLYSGFLNEYIIEMIEYELPYGFEYVATIPKSNQNTDVLVFVTLTDNLNNMVNSSEFSYHTDGLPPEISVIEINSPLVLKEKSISIEANVIDGTGISDVELYYRFSENDTWTIIQMSLLANTTTYLGIVPVILSNGNMTYYVRAFDQVGLSARSDEFTLEFIFSVSDDESNITIIVAVIAGVLAIAGVTYLVSIGKIKIPKRKKNE